MLPISSANRECFLPSPILVLENLTPSAPCAHVTASLRRRHWCLKRKLRQGRSTATRDHCWPMALPQPRVTPPRDWTLLRPTCICPSSPSLNKERLVFMYHHYGVKPLRHAPQTGIELRNAWCISPSSLHAAGVQQCAVTVAPAISPVGSCSVISVPSEPSSEVAGNFLWRNGVPCASLHCS